MIKFDSIFKQIDYYFSCLREIAKNDVQYYKLNQFVLLIFVLFLFFFISIYTMFAKEYRIEMSIIFTVIVGLIGTIVGMFFNYNSIENLRSSIEKKDRTAKNTASKLDNTRKKLLDKQLSLVNKFEKYVSEINEDKK